MTQALGLHLSSTVGHRDLHEIRHAKPPKLAKLPCARILVREPSADEPPQNLSPGASWGFLYSSQIGNQLNEGCHVKPQPPSLRSNRHGPAHFRTLAGHDIRQRLSGAAGMGPAQGAMASVE